MPHRSGLALVACVVLSACGGTVANPSPAGPASAAASKPDASSLTPIKVSYSQPTAGFAHLWMAADKGYFRKYGLDAQVLQITPPADAQAVLNGETQFDFDGSAGVSAISSGAAMPFIAVTNPTYTQAFYGQQSIQKVSDVIGKTVAATTRSGSSDFALRALLAREGVDANKVNITYLRDDSAILAALQGGSVQAAVLTSPNTLRARAAGLRLIEDMATSRWHTVNQGLNVRKDWAQQHEDLVLAFLKGELEGLRDAKTDPQATKQTITKWTQVTDAVLLDEAYRTGNAGWVANPLAHDEDLQSIIDMSTEANVKGHKP
ncbi:MAG TPA: ABC transporter substrate-binding protein, partial [Chloroflexota bacterium]